MKALLAGACLLAAVAGHAMRVDNFMLLDQDGKAHELYYYSDASAVVLIVQGNGCPIVRNALPDYRAVSDVYAERGVRFLMINSNLQGPPRVHRRGSPGVGHPVPHPRRRGAVGGRVPRPDADGRGHGHRSAALGNRSIAAPSTTG